VRRQPIDASTTGARDHQRPCALWSGQGWVASEREVTHYIRKAGKGCHHPRRPQAGKEKLRPAVSCGEIIEPAADLVNPPHRLAVGREQEYGAVVDDDLDGALVVLDDKLVVLEGSPASGSP